MEWWRVRRVLNWANGTTLLGLGVARMARASVARGPRGLLLATDYRLAVPHAQAFTLGNVVLTRHDAGWLAQRPRLLAHEERHTGQYAVLGLSFLPLYALAAGYSYLRASDPATHNAFERLAGLEDGGYPAREARLNPRKARLNPRKARLNARRA